MDSYKNYATNSYNIYATLCLSPMVKYEFALILKGQYELTEEIADELFEAGCDDGTPGICNGVFSIDFRREDDSLEAAIRSAITDVKSAGTR